MGRGFLPFFCSSKTPLSGTTRAWFVGAVSFRHVRRGRMTDSFLPLCAHRKAPELGAVTLRSPGSPGVLSLCQSPCQFLCQSLSLCPSLPCPELFSSCLAWSSNANPGCRDLVCSKQRQSLPQLPQPRAGAAQGHPSPISPSQSGQNPSSWFLATWFFGRSYLNPHLLFSSWLIESQRQPENREVGFPIKGSL